VLRSNLTLPSVSQRRGRPVWIFTAKIALCILNFRSGNSQKVDKTSLIWVVSLVRFCVKLRSNAAIVSLAFRRIGAWLYVILLSNAAIFFPVWSIAKCVWECMIKACLKHDSTNDLVFHAWLALMLFSIYFNLLMLMLTPVFGVFVVQLCLILEFCLCCTIFDCSRRDTPATWIISGKFRYKNQKNILILSWSNVFLK